MVDDRTTSVDTNPLGQAESAVDALTGVIEGLRRDAAFRLAMIPGYEDTNKPQMLRLAALYEGYAEAADLAVKQLTPIVEQLKRNRQQPPPQPAR